MVGDGAVLMDADRLFRSHLVMAVVTSITVYIIIINSTSISIIIMHAKIKVTLLQKCCRAGHRICHTSAATATIITTIF